MCPRSKEEFKEIREARREDIEQAALTCFALNGYHATTISDIAKKAKISKGLLYNYFSSKEDLLSVLFMKFSDEVMSKIDSNRNNVIEDKEADEFVDKYIDFIDTNREYCKLFIQISVQPGILDMIAKGKAGAKVMKNQAVLMDYFKRLSKGNAEVDMIFFTSLLKGFSMQYVFAPEKVTPSQLKGIKDLLLVILNRKSRK